MMVYNNWDVIFTTIKFVERVLNGHDQVISFERQNDINFIIKRIQGDSINMVLVNRYILGIADVYAIIDEFPDTDCIVTSANWNHYTLEAKDYGLKSHIGIFNIAEFSGALWWDDFITYHKKDGDGNPIYATK